MPEPTPMIFVVDDDESIRRAMSRLIKTWGYGVTSFADAESFLEAQCSEHAACAILDVHMPALNGLELQTEIAKRGRELPIVFLTGHGDIPKAVRAMKGGAVDFLQKPAPEADLRNAVERALDLSAAALREARELENAKNHLAKLTPRELDTLRGVISGAPNKVIAYRLDITERTVKAHRQQVMEKMRVRSVAELVRLVEPLGVEPDRG